MSTKFPELFFHGIALEQETVAKFLGVFIDENIIWKTHINTAFTMLCLGGQQYHYYQSEDFVIYSENDCERTRPAFPLVLFQCQ